MVVDRLKNEPVCPKMGRPPKDPLILVKKNERNKTSTHWRC